MTLEEAQKIGRIIGMSDDGYICSVRFLVEQCSKMFPEFVWHEPVDDPSSGGWYKIVPVTEAE